MKTFEMPRRNAAENNARSHKKEKEVVVVRGEAREESEGEL